jgi:glycerol-3-phosphate acyltransferase PlsX
MLQLASAGKVDAIISAGNTGAFVAGCQLRLGTLAGVSRPGIGVTIPTFHGPLVLCDVGANIAAKPHHLHDYAVMASLYARHVIGIEEPRVALLSIGEEDVKGTELVRQTRALLRNNESIRFVGNVEGQALFAGECEVVVCDGFVGNIVLKLTEGLAEGLFRTIAKEIEDEAPELTRQFEPMVKAIWARHDYSEYGGALLLGVDGVCVICHGRSERRAIANAIRVAAEFGRLKLNSKIVENLGP